MITLDEHNKIRRDTICNNNGPCLNGIACPKCGEELLDTSPSYILMSCPPQLNIHCSNCDYKGYRIR